ncbi:MAG: hypothetical protein E7773_02310 [Sphingomonas sp.]|uniref:hypothetical protein n=1 Tax=Sphingomonas sp. TaxID=28214 RepID=UPI00121AC925|nr:hypothetical protein [Sphingomonas sp.]THD37832.1 MAG: hypothetical protein E7773_02310 [Sphingomonas sp.]
MVELTKAAGRWPAGTQGTVVLVHNGGEAFEVEISGTDFNNTPIEDSLLTLYPDAVKKIDA